jgi:hypothetical protein
VSSVLERTLDLLGGMVLEDGSLWGESAAGFQVEDAEAVADPASGVTQHLLTRPRGGRKSTDVAALTLALLAEQAPPMARAYCGAADLEQAQEIIDAADGLIARTPALAALFRVTNLTVTNVRNGASLTALPADVSGFGKRAWLIVLDEVANWPQTRKHRRFWGVLMSGNRKVPGCRTVVISNSGTPDHWFHARRQVAITSPRWRVHEVPGPLPWLSADDVEGLRENAETPSEFERLVLNRWVAAEDRLASRADVEACTRLPESPLRMPVPRLVPPAWARYAVGVDMATTRDNAVVSVGHLVTSAEGRRRVVVDDLRVWTPRPGAPVPHEDVEAHVEETAKAYGAVVVYDPAEMRGMAQRLTRVGVSMEQFTFTESSVGRLALTLLHLLSDHDIALPADVDLVDELVSVQLMHRGPGRWRLDHDAGAHDDRAVSLALMAQWLLQNAQPARFDMDGNAGTVLPYDGMLADEVFERPGTYEHAVQLIDRDSGSGFGGGGCGLVSAQRDKSDLVTTTADGRTYLGMPAELAADVARLIHERLDRLERQTGVKAHPDDVPLRAWALQLDIEVEDRGTSRQRASFWRSGGATATVGA